MTKTEIIIEARRKHEAGDFNRQVVTHSPNDFFTDNVMLDCGHQRIEMARLVGRDLSCHDCLKNWMQAQEG